MDRRTIAGNSYIALATCGGAAVIGALTTAPTLPFHVALLYGGGVLALVGIGGLIYLWLIPRDAAQEDEIEIPPPPEGSGITIIGCTAEGNRAGGFHFANGSSPSIINSTAKDNGGPGFQFGGDDDSPT